MRYFLVACCMAMGWGCGTDHSGNTDWSVRGGDKAQQRYSELTQIDTSNVDDLEVAWTYRTGDIEKDASTQIQTNPLVIDGMLFGVSPKLNVFALDAASGEEKWRFDPFTGADSSRSSHRNRGLSYWEGGGEARILFTAGSYLYALDARTGELIEEFGEQGRASLKEGLSEQFRDYYVVATSPGTIYGNLIIIGSLVSEGTDSAPGDIKAYNVKTGALEWTFHTIPRPGEYGYDTWDDPEAWKKIGGANSWAGMALDEDRGVIYIPTGSAAPDFYGGDRKGANLFANSLLALDASTGERIWHYQTVHHDLWDRDLPSPPTLVTVEHEGERVDAVAQPTKTGFVFLFDRETGEPLFDINEIPVPDSSTLEGEEVWPTQPVPSKPEPLMRQQMSTDDINPYVSEEEQEILREKLTGLRSDHFYEPPSLQGTLQFPGFDGGAEWGGSAFDPQSGLLYVNTNEVPWILQIIDTRPEEDTANPLPLSQAVGRDEYMSACVACHGTNLKGSGRSPSLIGVEDRRSPEEILALINSGRGMMPSFSQLPEARKKAIVNFLINREHYAVDISSVSDKKEVTGNSETARYILNGYQKFRTEAGYPAISPPWGRLNAVDLNTGEIAWQMPLGEYPSLREKGIPATGTENYGGPVATKGGVLFIAATLDKKIRAFNKATGALLWEEELPYAGFATPAVYEVNGKQYVVIACGGGKLGVESGDAYVAFSLPD
ncbi:PQQ-binding-like beta-propeller repeat protein [Fodinibius sediminis]|uniref:Quinoprotein glucose dehydrogenase n=1 Tax=Fodinibius sediminis TaxID=1214077 RepID=A0A521AB17_9BACT|nr:PQQ-binding-like beta-propeller repeat protein [Fodinibius sediminis]SMO31986.1 quinoprotein glucose dehydrogenase [Fodinibius sediminis]